MGEIHSVGPFILGKSLGAGSTGKVKLGFHKDTGFKVAIKIMNKEALSSRPSMRKKVEREIVVMKLIDHGHVLKLHDVYETSKYLFLVLEYVEGGELFDYLITKGSLEPMEALRFFQQLIRGLDHCHSQRICHRDLKPENLLLDSDKNIKIADFGMASLMRRGALLGTSCGSPHYASPEVVTGKQYSGMTADVWSCGVILYALLTGKLPFDDDDIRKLLGKVKSGVFTMPAFLPKDSQDLISKMLTVDPAKRITMQQIKEHPWFNANSPDPQNFPPSVSVEDMSANPLVDVSAIDDEILRSLKVLGLGSDIDIEHSLTSKKPNLTLVFYRILEERKEKQTNNNYIHSRANRNRSNTHEFRERSLSEHTRSQSNQDGKARSNSFAQPEGTVTRVLSLSSKQRRPSPFVDAKRGGSHGIIFPLSPSNSSSNPTTTFTVSEDTATITNLASSGSSEFAPIAPVTSPPTSPHLRAAPTPANASKDRDKYRKFAQSPPPSPPLHSQSSSATPSSPINISNKFRIMHLANEGGSSPQQPGSPIIGSNPKRSWFSNFFTGSPHTLSPLDDDSSVGPSLTVRDSNHPPPLPHLALSPHMSSQPTPSHNFLPQTSPRSTPSHPPASHLPSFTPLSPRSHSNSSSSSSSSSSSTSKNVPIRSSNGNLKTSTGISNNPSTTSFTTHATSQPIITHATSQPIATHTTNQPIATHATSQPIATHATNQPIATHATNQPTSSHSTSQPITTHSASQPITMNHSNHHPYASSHSININNTTGTMGISTNPNGVHGPSPSNSPSSPIYSFSPNFSKPTGLMYYSPTNNKDAANPNNPITNVDRAREAQQQRERETHRESRSRTSMEMQTGKSGVELGAEIQRTLSALKTSWRLHTNELYTAKFDGLEGCVCQFSVELTDLKHNNLNLVSVSHLAGNHSFFETVCDQFQAEVKL